MAGLNTLLVQGKMASLQSMGGCQAPCGRTRTGRVVVMSATPTTPKQAEMVESESSSRRAMLVSTLAVAGSLLAVGRSDATIQKIEGRERETQEAVTRGVREPSNLSAAKSNRVQEAAKTNAQASGGLILGAPKDTPKGAYRSTQTSDESTSDPGVTKISSPTNVLKKRAEGKAASD
ncbi:hypothetical protein R1flu_026702 [Riccia fluitans]|uniref:Uncharacterized protein n=1 Tax=Riccia fluitans TaxID=41844 RepID=A0ABD1XHA7_9MARC